MIYDLKIISKLNLSLSFRQNDIWTLVSAAVRHSQSQSQSSSQVAGLQEELELTDSVIQAGLNSLT